MCNNYISKRFYATALCAFIIVFANLGFGNTGYYAATIYNSTGFDIDVTPAGYDGWRSHDFKNYQAIYQDCCCANCPEEEETETET